MTQENMELFRQNIVIRKRKDAIDMTKEVNIKCDFCNRISAITYLTDWQEEISSCHYHIEIAKHLIDNGDF